MLNLITFACSEEMAEDIEGERGDQKNTKMVRNCNWKWKIHESQEMLLYLEMGGGINIQDQTMVMFEVLKFAI